MREFQWQIEPLEPRLLLAAELIGIGPEGPGITEPGDGGFLGIDYNLPNDYIGDHLNLEPDSGDPLVPDSGSDDSPESDLSPGFMLDDGSYGEFSNDQE